MPNLKLIPLFLLITSCTQTKTEFVRVNSKVDTAAIIKPHIAYLDSAMHYKFKYDSALSELSKKDAIIHSRGITIQQLLTQKENNDSILNPELYSRIQEFEGKNLK